MLIKITLALIIILVNAEIVSAQFFEAVEKEAERILISLSDGKSVDPSSLTELNGLLSSVAEKDLAGYSSQVDKYRIDSLKNHLIEFESELKNISTDSAFVLFNDWHLHFQNIFYEYSKEKFFSSPKQKILFFSTSMSCYCTLKMSREQTVEPLKYVAGNSSKYDYWIIDSYWHNELQIEYMTLFAPSVIVFNGDNEMLHKIEYDKKMIAQLTDYFNSKKH
jgi:hypothetical protein